MHHAPRQLGFNPVPSGIVPLVLPQPLPGYESFIVAWLLPGPPVLLIDPGPAASIPHLCQQLASAGIDRLDAVLLTHIHLDHAGGVGTLADRFPDVPIVCAPEGQRHLSAPDRLWEQTQRVLGPVATAYGPPRPVPTQRLASPDAAGQWGVASLATPGHAAGHTAYRVRNGIFVGEAVGVCIQLGDDVIYRRPATPPRFFMDTALTSLAVIDAADPDWICFGHVGGTHQPKRAMAAHKRQLSRWTKTAREAADLGSDDTVAADTMVRRLLVEDPELIGFDQLSADEQRRERYFLTNSAKGMLGAVSAASVPK